MLDEFDMVGRLDEKISSGETSILLQMQDDWHRLYHFEEFEDEYEDLTEEELYKLCKDRGLKVKEGQVKLHYINILKKADKYKKWTMEEVEEDPVPFLNEVKRLKIVPAYLYVLNYIFFRVNLALGRKNQKKFAEYIQAGVLPECIAENIDRQCSELLYQEDNGEEKEFEQKDFDIIYQQLIKRLSFEFMKNGDTGKVEWKGFFRGIVEGFNFEKLKELALGLHMPLDDFEIFLYKVLKRSGVNFYDRDEVFVYLVLKYADKYDCSRYFEAYHNLWKLYGDVKGDESRNGWIETESVSTVYMRKNLEELEASIDGNPFEGKSPSLESFISQIAYQNERLKSGAVMRTANKRFLKIWKDMKKRWEGTDQMQEDIAFDRKKKKSSGNSYHKKMTVRYRPDTGARIAGDTEFRKDTLLKKKDGGMNEEAVFKIYQDIILEPVADDKVEVKVKALLPAIEYKEYCKRKDVPKIMKKSPEFVKEDNLKEEKEAGRMVVDSPELVKAVHNISIGGKVRFADSDTKENKGTLIVECAVGTFIPAGTRFHFKIGEKVFSYESIEPANVQEYEIEVRPLQSWAEAGLNERASVSSESGEAIIIAIEDGFSIFNGGRLSLAAEKELEIPAKTEFCLHMPDRSIMFYSKKDTVIRKNREGVFQRSVEVSRDKGESLKKSAAVKKYDRFEFDSDVISAFCGKSDGVGYFNDGQKRHFITVICKKNCEIPKGTIFRYRTDFDEFLYETVNDFKIYPYAESEIDTRWTNEEFFQEYVDKNAKRKKDKKGEETDQFKEVEILPSNLEFDCDMKNIYSVTMEKRIVLQPEIGEDRRNKRNYQVSDSELLRRIYTSSKNAGEIKYYKGIPSYGEDFLLNTQLFKDTKLLQGTFRGITSNEERLRNYILTLKFLEFMWWKDEYQEENFLGERIDLFRDDLDCRPDLCDDIADYNMLIDDFRDTANDELIYCGFQPFFPTGYPYDAFLALLLTCEFPLALFQKIWSDEGLTGKEKKDEQSTT